MHKTLTLVMSSFNCNLILSKSNLINRNILLNNFKTETLYCIICKSGENAYFSYQGMAKRFIVNVKAKRPKENQ